MHGNLPVGGVTLDHLKKEHAERIAIDRTRRVEGIDRKDEVHGVIRLGKCKGGLCKGMNKGVQGRIEE